MSLIQAHFSSIFLLPPKEETRGLKPYLYFMMPLTFTTSERASVWERAMGRMRVLSFLLANYSSLKADPNEDRNDSCAEIQMPILRQLLGHLLLFLSFKKEETSCLALDILCFLFQFKHQQHFATLKEENAQLQEDWEAKITSLSSSPSATHITELFAEYLQPPERTDMVLVFIEAMSDSSTFDTEAGRNMLDMVMGNCDFWLVDVPKITSLIYKPLGCINTAPARWSVESLIVQMADKCPGEVVSTTLLTIAPPGDSTALALWEVMFSVPQTLQNVLKELLIQLQDRHYRVLYTHWVDTTILRLAILASSDLQDEEFAPMYLVMRFLRQRRPTVLSLLLRAMMTLSQRGEMTETLIFTQAIKMKVMLPDLMWVLQYGNKAIKIKALVVFRSVMAQLEREKASPIAVLLAEFLLPFFGDELSQLRKISISLFRDLMKMAVGNDKSKMKNTVRRGLLPLFFRMSDQVQSVAKVARKALLGAAELLKWKQLEDLVQAQQKWRIGESLLEQDRSSAEEYLSQSLLYLGDAQASLREAALRFIAIQPLEQDSEPSICSLAAQTIVIISHSLGQPNIQSTWVTPSVQECLQDHHKGPQEGSGWPRSTNTEAAAEAECLAPAPQGPTADDVALWDTAQRIVSEAVRRAVAEVVAAGQEPEEQQDLAQCMDVEDENSKEGCQGGDTIHSIWINPSVQEHLQDAPAGPQEGSGLPSCTDTEAAAEAERLAPAQHSPTEDDMNLSDIVEYIVSEAVRRAEAEIQGPGQELVEQQDLAQCTDVPVAAPAPAGLEAIEAHLAGEDEGQASTAPLIPAAKEEEENTVSPMSAEHGGETSADIACPAHGPAPRRRPSRFRRVLRALRRASRCSCTAGQQEE
ncbi:hypothetical protein Q9233_007816 [Columba guinea]|nr:hypothetical protein Q9233_007816 [Columba guinea]